MLPGDGALSGDAMTRLVIGTVTLAIVVSVLLRLIFNRQQNVEPRDERDYLIERTSVRWFTRVLVLGILAVVVLIAAQSMVNRPDITVFPLTPLSIAILLLFTLMLASLIDSVTQLYCYRRGF